MQGLDESTQPGFPELGRPVSRPVRTRGFCFESMSRLTEQKLPKMSFTLCYTFFLHLFLYVRTILWMNMAEIGQLNELA